jgi:mono/diheme cytochrome c family protein
MTFSLTFSPSSGKQWAEAPTTQAMAAGVAMSYIEKLVGNESGLTVPGVDRRTMNASRWLNGLCSLLLIGAVSIAMAGCAASIGPVPAPSRSSFDRTEIVKGSELAAIGNCMLCHTAPGGKAFAGGRAIPTPFGTIFSTNITPDPETGIGHWSEYAFRRAMHEGIDRSGDHLFPAFPYDHFTKVADDDVAAIYAFLMTREPVSANAPPNTVPVPRSLLAAWNAMYLHEGPLQPDPLRSAVWNRGAYLVEGLGHCGSCHTPRNGLGAEKRGQELAGGDEEGWYSPALNAQSEAPIPWTQDSLVAYLGNGADESHGVAVGPMAPIVHGLSQVPEADLQAIATYLASVQSNPSPERRQQAGALIASAAEAAANAGGNGPVASPASISESGADIYRGACGTCHANGWRKPSPGMIPLAFSTALHTPDPRNLLHIILEGIHPTEGEAGPLMPDFAGALTNAQIGTLAAYLRSHFTTRPAWTDIDKRLTEIRANRESS